MEAVKRLFFNSLAIVCSWSLHVFLLTYLFRKQCAAVRMSLLLIIPPPHSRWPPKYNSAWIIIRGLIKLNVINMVFGDTFNEKVLVGTFYLAQNISTWHFNRRRRMRLHCDLDYHESNVVGFFNKLNLLLSLLK